MVRDRYNTFLEHVITETLAGRIQSEAQLERLLTEQIEAGTGEIFERILDEQLQSLQQTVNAETDELKQAKATRKLRALKKLHAAWEKWQKQRQAQDASASAVQQIRTADPAERLTVLNQALDPNQGHGFNQSQIQQLAKALQQAAEQTADPAEAFELQQLATGLKRGLESYQRLEPHIVSWMYESQQAVGFESSQVVYGPWKTWATQVGRPTLQALFEGQLQNQPAILFAGNCTDLDSSGWVELMVVLRGLQNGLVAWLDKQPYSIQGGQHLAGVTFLVFSVIWCELSAGFQQASALPEHHRRAFSQASFQSALQILRTFARRDNFPLYGGVFASFSGEGFRETIAYLDQPLQVVENVQEKARILTVLGYSQRLLGQHERALLLHREALELARQAKDQRCEIANLNHFSRLSLYRKDYEEATNHAQYALILARQVGDRQGEANALASLGYSQVMALRQQDEAVTPDDLELPIQGLERAQKLADKDDVQNLALCAVGLGIAYTLTEQFPQAKQALEQGVVMASRVGDRDLQGLSHAYLAEACYQLQQTELAVCHACLGMYLLEQRGNVLWEKPAALLTILRGQLGAENFATLLNSCRSNLVPVIGVDGFDHLPVLMTRYHGA
ncbi:MULTISPECIES: tetratricopeptide repeat protein [unclassified Leptolyngbya]|uniref:tetratricopeptide repeat protein n=1 Tax=unclassified Leptolyngbya TaxID=2650499 RepID=UPI00168405DE|nr:MULTISPECIES: tetratricopeptide repeat protein [unclassified Leptolyngbya]MBD1911307.1 tetratricopeptide repeat protein [Leptolyngbya sp. FACHB-8]MBD2156675.1 tetratricopeptide repeat protein [Leptolyngbya sp. FACHB-16]